MAPSRGRAPTKRPGRVSAGAFSIEAPSDSRRAAADGGIGYVPHVKRLPGRASCACVWLVLAACSASAPPREETCSLGAGEAGDSWSLAVDAGGAGRVDILLYTYSTGYRHASIPDGINVIRALGAANGLGVDVAGTAADALGSYCANQPVAGEDGLFTVARLSRYAAVVFLDTTTGADGALLDDVGRASLEAFVRAGGGFVGVHAAADAEYGWPFYGELLGSRFLAHGPPVTASLRVEDAAHPATSHLPNPWLRFDEWFDFKENPRATAHVLVNLDETTYPDNPAPMGDHPIAWCKAVGAGRSFYTGLGHHGAAFGDPDVRRHLLGGILYAAGIAPAGCAP